MKSFHIAKTFKENSDRVNHLDISSSGHYVVTSSQDESIQLYECDSGKCVHVLGLCSLTSKIFALNRLKKAVPSKKYGVDLISFTRNQNTVIHGSTKVDGTVVSAACILRRWCWICCRLSKTIESWWEQVPEVFYWTHTQVSALPSLPPPHQETDANSREWFTSQRRLASLLDGHSIMIRMKPPGSF